MPAFHRIAGQAAQRGQRIGFGQAIERLFGHRRVVARTLAAVVQPAGRTDGGQHLGHGTRVAFLHDGAQALGGGGIGGIAPSSPPLATLDRWAIESAARDAAIIILIADWYPPFRALARNIGFASLTLGIKRVELLLKTFLGRSPNAIRLQIVAAMIAYVLLRIAARQSQLKIPALRFAELVAGRLFSRTPIQSIDKPALGNPAAARPRHSPDQMVFAFA